MLRLLLLFFVIANSAFASDPSCDETILRPPEAQANLDLISFLDDKKCWKSPESLVPCLKAASRLAEGLGYSLSLETLALSIKTSEPFMPLQVYIEKVRTERIATMAAARSALDSANLYRERFTQLIATLREKLSREADTSQIILNAYLAYRRVNDPLYARISLSLAEKLKTTSETGNYPGFGIDELRLNGRYFAMPTPEGPADQAGLQRYDELLEVNGVKLEGLAGEARLKLYDDVEEVKLKVRRANGLHEIVVPKQEVRYLTKRLLEFEYDRYGYLRIAKFPNIKDCSEIVAAILRFEQQGAKGIIVDVRQNVGGNVKLPACLAGVFVGERSIAMAIPKIDLSRRTIIGAQPLVALRRYFHHQTNLPLAVLVDETSMSASELWAGAIQEFQRGWLIGETTAGKGQWNTILPHRSKTFAEIETVAEYKLPSMRSIQGIGIEPDFVVPNPNLPSMGLRYGDFFGIPIKHQDPPENPRADEIERIAAHIRFDAAQSSDPQLDYAMHVLARARDLGIKSEIKDFDGKWLTRYQVWIANRVATKLEKREEREAQKAAQK